MIDFIPLKFWSDKIKLQNTYLCTLYISRKFHTVLNLRIWDLLFNNYLCGYSVWLVSCALVRLNAIEEFIFRGTIDKFFRPISPPINSTLSDTKPIEPRTRESTYPVVNIFNPPIEKVDSSVESPSSNAHTEQR